jgi:hypothetical protein
LDILVSIMQDRAYELTYIHGVCVQLPYPHPVSTENLKLRDVYRSFFFCHAVGCVHGMSPCGGEYLAAEDRSTFSAHASPAGNFGGKDRRSREASRRDLTDLILTEDCLLCVLNDGPVLETPSVVNKST